MSDHSPPPRSQIVLDADHFEMVMGRLMDQIERRDRAILESLTDAVAKGLVVGQRQALEDKELQKNYWTIAFEHLARQAHDNVSRSVGRKVIGWVSVALLSAGVTLAAINAKGP